MSISKRTDSSSPKSTDYGRGLLGKVVKSGGNMKAVKENEKICAFAIEKDVWIEFKKTARRDGRSASSLIRKLIYDYLDQQKNSAKG